MTVRKYIGPYLSQPSGTLVEVLLHAQNAAIAATPLLGGNGSGMFRASVWHTTDTSGAAGSMQLILKATGQGNDPTLTFALPPLNVGAAGNQAASFVIVSSGTADITYEVDFTGVTVGSLAYSVRIVVEQLSTSL